MRLTLTWPIAIALSACATLGSPDTVPPTGFRLQFNPDIDLDAYTVRVIGVLPVAFGPLAEESQELSALLQKRLIAEATTSLGLKNLIQIPEARIRSYELSPLPTASQLAAVGKSLKLDGIMRITINSYSEPDKIRPGYASMNIDFADSQNPEAFLKLISVARTIGPETSVADVMLKTLADDFEMAGHILRSRRLFARTPGPLLAIISPHDRFETDKAFVRIRTVAGDAKGLTRVIASNATLKHEKILFDSATRGSTTFLERSVTLPLAPGKNTIEVTSGNLDGVSTARTVTIARVPEKERLWLLAVGIGKYVAYGAIDRGDGGAAALAQFFKETQQTEQQNVIVLTGQGATLREVKKAIDFIGEQAGPKDRIIAYFSGRVAVKAEKLQLMPYDAELGFKSTMFEAADLRALDVGSGLIAVVDGCAEEDTELKGAPSQDLEDFILVVQGCEPRETTLASILIEALRGAADRDGDKIIIADEFIDFIAKKGLPLSKKPRKLGFALGRVAPQK